MLSWIIGKEKTSSFPELKAKGKIPGKINYIATPSHLVIPHRRIYMFTYNQERNSALYVPLPTTPMPLVFTNTILSDTNTLAISLTICVQCNSKPKVYCHGNTAWREGIEYTISAKKVPEQIYTIEMVVFPKANAIGWTQWFHEWWEGPQNYDRPTENTEIGIVFPSGTLLRDITLYVFNKRKQLPYDGKWKTLGFKQ